MPALKDQRHELYAQGLALDMTQHAAYIEAGYKPNRAGAARLAAKASISNRVLELKNRAAIKVSLTKSYILEATIENAEKSMGRKPVKITRRVKVGDDFVDEVKEVYMFRPDAANQALRMLGSEFGLFVERKDVRISNEYAGLSDEELAKKLVEVGQLMLSGPIIEHDEDEE